MLYKILINSENSGYIAKGYFFSIFRLMVYTYIECPTFTVIFSNNRFSEQFRFFLSENIISRYFSIVNVKFIFANRASD